eukprot:34033-Pelagomonas_calceolata.AAC.1
MQPLKWLAEHGLPQGLAGHGPGHTLTHSRHENNHFSGVQRLGLLAGGLLSMNFHKDLLAMGQEVHYWERLRMPIPYIAMEINAQRDKYRVLRDNILMVVRDYNKILTTLDREERMLFNDRIRHLDRRIMPGVSKLDWVADKHALEFYYKEARRCALAGRLASTPRASISWRPGSELLLVRMCIAWVVACMLAGYTKGSQ